MCHRLQSYKSRCWWWWGAWPQQPWMPEAPSQPLGFEHDLKHVMMELSSREGTILLDVWCLQIRRLFPKCGLGGILRPVHIEWKTLYQTGNAYVKASATRSTSNRFHPKAAQEWDSGGWVLGWWLDLNNKTLEFYEWKSLLAENQYETFRVVNLLLMTRQICFGQFL